MSFAIIDLNSAKLVDSVSGYSPVHSPDNRFIIYINGFSPHSPFPTEDHYRLYDLQRTPVENTCGYRDNDPKHESLDNDWRGQPVYSLKKDEMFRPNENPEGFSGSGAHERAGTFWWSSDSSKVLFADSQGEVVSLVLVVMPKTNHALSSTLVYRLPDRSEVSTQKLNWSGLKFVEWDGDTIRATLQTTAFRGRKDAKIVSVKEAEFKLAPR